jgi:hypothetical protein
MTRKIGLPRRIDAADTGDAQAHCRGSGSEHRSRTETSDDAADRDQQQRAHHIEQRDRARDESGRPAPGLDQLMQIDAGPEQAERVGDQGGDQADRDHAPAVEKPGHASC